MHGAKSVPTKTRRVEVLGAARTAICISGISGLFCHFVTVENAARRILGTRRVLDLDSGVSHDYFVFCGPRLRGAFL